MTYHSNENGKKCLFFSYLERKEKMVAAKKAAVEEIPPIHYGSIVRRHFFRFFSAVTQNQDSSQQSVFLHLPLLAINFEKIIEIMKNKRQQVIR
jgi:hypothetical protein